VTEGRDSWAREGVAEVDISEVRAADVREEGGTTTCIDEVGKLLSNALREEEASMDLSEVCPLCDLDRAWCLDLSCLAVLAEILESKLHEADHFSSTVVHDIFCEGSCSAISLWNNSS
jgi:hypothetical protein